MAVWVIGAGSGIGRAAALSLAQAGFTVFATGRRKENLAETCRQVHDAGGSCVVLPGDVRNTTDLEEILHSALDGLPLAGMVYCAGTNTRDRFWANLKPKDFATTLDTNLSGAVRTTALALPEFRAQGGGFIILVSSWAAWRHSPGAGPAYSASKLGLGVISETLNSEEAANGIRATHLCPGEVATDILDTRPNPPSPAERRLMLLPKQIGDVIAWLATQPASVCINEIVVTPTHNSSYKTRQ